MFLMYYIMEVRGMNKKVLTILLVAVLIGLLSVGGVYAGNLIKNFGSDGNGNLLFIFKKLNLTDEQKTKIEEILKDLKAKSGPIFEDIKKKNSEEKEILSKEVLDEDSLNLLVESQIKNIVNLSYLKKDAYLKIVDILDNEQRKIFPTFTLFLKSKPFILNNEKVEEFISRSNDKIKDLLVIGKRLNLTDEQKEILKDMIKEENSRKVKFLNQFEFRFLVKKLDLTEEETSKLKDLFINEKQKEKEIHEKIKDNNSKQREILKSDNYNRETLSSYIDEYITLESEILNLRKNLYFDYLKILTFEQREKSPISLFFFKLI